MIFVAKHDLGATSELSLDNIEALLVMHVVAFITAEASPRLMPVQAKRSSATGHLVWFCIAVLTMLPATMAGDLSSLQRTGLGATFPSDPRAYSATVDAQSGFGGCVRREFRHL